MTDDLHALIHRLADELDCYWQMLTDDRTAQHPLAIEAHAALARWGRPTPPPPNDLSHLSEADFQALCPQGYHGVGDDGQQPPSVEGPSIDEIWQLCADHEFYLGIDGANEDESANRLLGIVTEALARWGNHPESPDSSPQPPSGEVAELVELFRYAAENDPTFSLTSADMRLAADLLEQLSPPQPIPVSERLPGPQDCDAEGRCWWGRAESDDWSTDWTLATYESVAEFCEFTPRTVWLPAHALPAPADD